MIRSEKNSEHYIWGGDCEGWHLLKSESLSVIKERVPAGRFEVRHYHEKAEQFFYILSGTATLEVDGCENVVNAGEGLYIPAGVPHQLKNESQNEVIFIVTSTPPSHGDRVESTASC
ncbi:MAG: cupin domain-containing protein [Candidatus Thiodiazotropha sp.]|jgi:mannose-6-phosphate isomerase-like protein (cupin superfamily)